MLSLRNVTGSTLVGLSQLALAVLLGAHPSVLYAIGLGGIHAFHRTTTAELGYATDCLSPARVIATLCQGFVLLVYFAWIGANVGPLMSLTVTSLPACNRWLLWRLGWWG